MLIESLALGTVQPDTVTLVTNADVEVRSFGLNVRLLRFRSQDYAIGDRDVALRCNIGIWESRADAIVFQGDDQIASPTMVEDSIRLLSTKDHFWGHHRYTVFGAKSVPEIMALPYTDGRPRERGTNREHLYQSCYSGMLGISVEAAKRSGGFDMAFNCRHAGEDQNLGRRLDGVRVFIHEPPFSWHPEDPPPWGPPGWSNLCVGEHDVVQEGSFLRCRRCPFRQYVGPSDDLFGGGDPLVPYEHGRVEVREETVP